MIGKYFIFDFFREIKTYYDMSLWGFSPFESSFSAKMAKATPTQVFVNKKVLTERERERTAELLQSTNLIVKKRHYIMMFSQRNYSDL